MKKLLLLLLLSLGFIGSAYAHSGNTDSKGGHWNWKNFTYHCHTCNTDSSDEDSIIDILDILDGSDSPLCRSPANINGIKGESKEACLARHKAEEERILKRVLEDIPPNPEASPVSLIDILTKPPNPEASPVSLIDILTK